MTTTSAPPVAPSDPSRVPLPPVSENATLQTEPRPSTASSRPPSVQTIPQFAFSNSPALHSGMPYNMPYMPTLNNTTTPPPLVTNNSNGGTIAAATKIDMDRIMRQDEAAMNDFVPPRQAMNSDESDFDWDEDIKIDESGQVHKKKENKNNGSHWRKLSPFLRMVISVLVGCPIVALPAILVSVLMDDDQEEPAYPTKSTVMLIFVWLSFMWGIIFITNWGIDIVPVVVVRLTGFVTGSRSEDLKSKLLMFVACKKYFKWLLASCWAIGSFAFLSKSPFSRTNAEMSTTFIEVLGCLVAGSALVFVEKILLHLISTNFHQTAYADRMTENKYALSVLDRLSTSKKVNNANKQGKGGRPTHSRHNTADNVNLQNNNTFQGMNNNTATEYAFPTGYHSAQPSRSNSMDAHGSNKNGSPGRVGGSLDGTEILHEIHGDGGTLPKTTEAIILSSTPLTTPTDMIKTNSRQSTLVPSIRNQRGNRDSKFFNNNHNNNIFKGINRRLHGIALANKSSPSKDIGSTANAKRLAKTLFYNLQTNGEDLVVENFYPYFSTQEEARTAFAIFDKDGNGDISKSEMKEKIFYVYKERKDLHTSLRDLSQAVGKLNVIFLTIVAVIWLFIILSIFGKDIVKNMLSIGSFLVALSFVFGNSLKILFENIVFLFITHPYDSGDLVSIEGTDMYVREVGLNSTTFVTWDGKRMYYPNNLISSKPIHNVRRSPNMTDKIVLNIDCYTPQSKIFELRARMRDYLIRESKDFLPDLEIQIQEMDAKLKISMCIEHKGNWQDSGRRWARRTAFNYALKEAVEEIGIQYYALPQRVELHGRGDGALRDLAMDSLQPGGGSSSNPAAVGHAREGGSAEATLGPNSPLRQYSPEHVAHLYRRTTINKPQGEGGE
ncbi:hypothetical protein BGZ97_007248 [Linnemannia gamsii]|uniref:EF-hand domain-containing protein n=1 Tax=Linnemannia gamsii TaxID=64522 RepID=A0A9P6UE72_9FUNG|nr:hypothetical protein BGZ97_007248 [Linnemannia gamsii]